MSELDYFELFNRYHQDDCHISLIHFDKKNFDTNQTDRDKLVNMMQGWVVLEKQGLFTPFHLVTEILFDISTELYEDWDENVQSIFSDSQINDIVYSFNRIRDDALKMIKNQNFCTDGTVPPDKVSDIISLVFNLSKQQFPELTDFPGIYVSDKYNPIAKDQFSVDRVFIVFDRDLDIRHPKGRTDDDYRKIKQMCDKLGYDVLISTPMFELWLLLHHPNVYYGDYYATLTDEMRLRMANDLDRLEGRDLTYPNDKYDRKIQNKNKRINAKRFEKYYKDSFDFAVESSQKIGRTDFEYLLTSPGSNVGIMLKQLLN